MLRSEDSFKCCSSGTVSLFFSLFSFTFIFLLFCFPFLSFQWDLSSSQNSPSGQGKLPKRAACLHLPHCWNYKTSITNIHSGGESQIFLILVLRKQNCLFLMLGLSLSNAIDDTTSQRKFVICLACRQSIIHMPSIS